MTLYQLELLSKTESKSCLIIPSANGCCEADLVAVEVDPYGFVTVCKSHGGNPVYGNSDRCTAFLQVGPCSFARMALMPVDEEES